MSSKDVWYNHIEEWNLCLCFGLMTAIVGVNVLLRFVGGSLSWGDQAARILFVWCTMIGVSLAALKGTHLKVEAINAFFPRAAVWINLVGDIISLIYAVIVCYLMWTYIQNMMEFPQYFSAIPWLSATVMYIPGVIGMAGFCVRICQGSIIPTIKMIRNRSCSEDSGASGK